LCVKVADDVTGVIYFIRFAGGRGGRFTNRSQFAAQILSQQSGFVSFAVGTLALAIIALPQGIRWNFGEIIGFPWWVWTGGLLGAFFVISAILLVPRFGAATYLVLNLTGQMITALVLDHYGLLGLPVQRISFLRIVGAILLVLGVVLIRRF
jgi:transporter family-2 protein